MNKKITVIGNGPLSLSVATRLAVRHAIVTYIDLRNELKKGNNVPIRVTGLEEYIANLHEVTDGYISVESADIVMITVTASSHETVIDSIASRIKKGQMVVFFPASFGAIRFLKKLGALASEITVCEAVSFPCVSVGQGPGSICIQNIKSSLRMAVKPENQAEDAIKLLNQYFDLFVPAKNLLETSMDNMNMVLHPLPVLLNASWAEKNPETFRHYIDGISQSVGNLMQNLDDERMEIGKAFGIKLTSAYDQLVQYYGERGLNSLWEYASSMEGPYTKVSGFGLRSRYVEEDVPYLLVAAADLGKSCGVPTPTMDLCLLLANALMQTDYAEKGYTLSRMGLDGLTKEEILKYV